MPSLLSQSELAELRAAFTDIQNYESEDPLTPIDPLTYCAPDGDTCLHIASHRGNLRAVELLLRAGLDVDKQGDMGYTALHYARTPEIVECLLAYGASPNIKSEFGKLPKGWSDQS
jgi:ankyrin repeat protein